MECDFCENKNEDDLILGRWIIYCKKCKEGGGEQRDQDLFYENECCNGDRLDGLDGEGMEMLEGMMI